MKELRDWTDDEVGSALLSILWRQQDAGGLSHGRSWDNRVLEAAQALLDLPRPSGDLIDWPAPDDIVTEAEQRHRARVLMRLASEPYAP